MVNFSAKYYNCITTARNKLFTQLNMSSQPQAILLASSSRYRQHLLKKIIPAFESAAPQVDESPKANETAKQLAVRLGLAKAHALQTDYPDHLIIASDQVASCNALILGKPGNRDAAIQQLVHCNAQQVTFYTSVIVLNAQNGEVRQHLDQTQVYFRQLSLAQITHYIDREQPYDCAGSFKAEALGIALFEKIESSDPNALIGLPLIALVTLLASFGYTIL